MDEKEMASCFRKVFLGCDEGKIVLQELARFAHADDADFCVDARKSEYLQGRRSVVLEIRKIMRDER